jgi:hypothetical protein
MILACKRCPVKPNREEQGGGTSRPEFDRYEGWLMHLVSPPHQRVVEGTLRRWNDSENERSYVVTKTDSLNNSDVLEYFTKFGMIGEFYFESNMRFCVVRVDPLVGLGRLVLVHYHIASLDSESSS